MHTLNLYLTLLFFIPLVWLTAESETESAKGTDEAEKTVKEGNLSFPVSQQEAPLVSFGQNVLEEKTAQVLVFGNQVKAHRQYSINTLPIFYYGITDSLTLSLSCPVDIRNKEDHFHSSGIGDISGGLEYAYYTKAHKNYYDQATILAAISMPTGSVYKNPITGIGANSYFFGTTASRMGINWFYYVSTGGLFTEAHHKNKSGNQFLYQAGIGRRITNTKKWLFAWQLELDGTYTAKTLENHVLNRNSGSNIIILTPSLWLSAVEHFICQIGISLPLYQNVFGDQRKNHYTATATLGWTF